MLLYGIVAVSLVLSYVTEVRRAPVMGETIQRAQNDISIVISGKEKEP